MEKFRARYGISSKLQEDILNYVCRNSDGTYNILSTHTDRNERTIGQSVRTLEKNFYVEIQQTREGKNRRKKIIVPTFKGICYGLAYLNLDFRDCINVYGDEREQLQFSEYLQKIKDYSKLCEYNKYNSMLYFENDLFNGAIPTITNFEDALKMGVKIGDVAAHPNSDSGHYIAKQEIKVAQEVLGPQQLQHLKNFLDEKKQEIIKGMDKEIKKLDSQ